jgi:hypothetical protein
LMLARRTEIDFTISSFFFLVAERLAISFTITSGF